MHSTYYYLWYCVVFFKQKTAYEMRISDWSSDVCSSDLRGLDRHQPSPHRSARRLSDAGSQHRVRIQARHLEGGCRAEDHGTGDAEPGRERQTHQIGRASCRERVCQSGVDLGGRRIIKNKQKTQINTPYIHKKLTS